MLVPRRVTIPYAPCMVYSLTFGVIVNVGKYPIHGASGHVFFQGMAGFRDPTALENAVSFDTC